MAIALTAKQLEEQKKSKVPGASTFKTTTQGETTDAGASVGPKTDAGTPVPDKGPKGSGWTNLQDYLKVNVGEGQRMADTVVADESGKADESIAGITEQADENIKFFQDANQVQTAGKDYFDTLPGATDFSKYYSQDLDPTLYDANLSATPEAKQAAAAAGSQGGRKALLGDSSFARDNYGSGDRGFDSFLMGAQDTSLEGDLGAVEERVAGAQEAQAGRYGSAVSARDQEIQDAQDAFRGQYQGAQDASRATRDQVRTDAAARTAAIGGDRQATGEAEGFDTSEGEAASARLRALANLSGQTVGDEIDWGSVAADRDAAVTGFGERVEVRQAEEAKAAAVEAARVAREEENERIRQDNIARYGEEDPSIDTAVDETSKDVFADTGPIEAVYSGLKKTKDYVAPRLKWDKKW